jgi:hypothetical protein
MFAILKFSSVKQYKLAITTHHSNSRVQLPTCDEQSNSHNARSKESAVGEAMERKESGILLSVTTLPRYYCWKFWPLISKLTSFQSFVSKVRPWCSSILSSWLFGSFCLVHGVLMSVGKFWISRGSSRVETLHPRLTPSPTP